ncbi:unnamed protein product, partial [Soboliphyme baturini]|uniref:HATPase_c domain-containing protein n=1 Tax=Soboliphyme baturini TaxID=241478 RepID=A0A183IX05_9BILA
YVTVASNEVFLRELISNASDALDKIRLLSLTDPSMLGSNAELNIRIKADKENNVLHITDTGIGMNRTELINNLGTIAHSGTFNFLSNQEDMTASKMENLIGQFGVGFYSSFLVADRVVVTSKSYNDDQYIWESDAGSFQVAKDPRGNTLGRGTRISLHFKPETREYLDEETLTQLLKKYSQFLSYDMFLWKSKQETPKADEEEGKEEKPKTKKVEKTVWDWEHVNVLKPIWHRNDEVTEEEYNEFYKSFTKDSSEPLAHIHFTAEGTVSFRALLFIPKRGASEILQNYQKAAHNIKVLFIGFRVCCCVFISNRWFFAAVFPKSVDSDDLPLNVSRETLQQVKLLKVIRKTLVRKLLDAIKKLPEDLFASHRLSYFSTKLLLIEDHGNRNRLMKIVRFDSSYDEKKQTTLSGYVQRMKPGQEYIYYLEAATRKEAEESPFVERLVKKGYEVLYLTSSSMDGYVMQHIPEFDNKKTMNIAKEGLKLDKSEKAKKRLEMLEETFKPLTVWLKEDALKDKRLTKSPCALVAGTWGWTGNMERIMRSQAYAKTDDPTQQFYINEKKILEINPHHPIMKELLNRVNSDKDDKSAHEAMLVLFDAATLRSGYMLRNSANFADRIELMIKSSLHIDPNEMNQESATEQGEHSEL